MTYYFEAITTYDQRTLREFGRYHYRHVRPGGPILLLLLGVLALLLGILQSDLVPMVTGAFAFAIAVSLLMGRFVGRVRQDQTRRIRFFDDRVEYAGEQDQGFYRYDQIIRLRENQGYFFLYVAKNRAILLDKSRMSLGTPDQLRLFLQQKVRPQFK